MRLVRELVLIRVMKGWRWWWWWIRDPHSQNIYNKTESLNLSYENEGNP
jgi:hypothetical protein